MSFSTRATASARSFVVEPKSEVPRHRPITEALAAPADLLVPTSHATIAVRQSAGQKMPTLLLHGNSSSKAIFDQQFASAVGQDYRLIGLDLPGHGASSDAYDPARSYTITGYADAVIEVIEQLGLEKVAVVGWSLGGHVAMEMMSLYPDLVGLMVMGAPAVEADPVTLQQGFNRHPDLLLAGKQAFAEADVEAFACATSGGSADPSLRDMIRRTDGRARAIMFANLFSGQVSNHRQTVETLETVPLAIVNGAEDPFINHDYVAALAYANLWRKTCHIVPRTGHAPFLQAPQVFNDLLARFLADMAERARAKGEDPPLIYSA